MGRFQRTLMIMIVVPIVLILLGPAVFSYDSFLIGDKEVAAVTEIIGPENHAKTVEQAITWYQMIWTGSYVEKRLTRQQTNRNIFGMEKRVSAKSSNYMANMQRQIYRAFYRVSVGAHILIATLAIFIAAMVDGFMQRNIRSQEFVYNNPVVFRLVSGVFLLTITSFTILPLWPGQLEQYIWLTAIVLIALSVWASSRHFQTGS